MLLHVRQERVGLVVARPIVNHAAVHVTCTWQFL
jgi:hypothetical protein